MERIWLKQYPAGVPADIDVNQYTSLVELLEDSAIITLPTNRDLLFLPADEFDRFVVALAVLLTLLLALSAHR